MILLILLLSFQANANQYVVPCEGSPEEYCIVTAKGFRPANSLGRAPKGVDNSDGDIIKFQYRPVEGSPTIEGCESERACEEMLPSIRCMEGRATFREKSLLERVTLPGSILEDFVIWCEVEQGFVIDEDLRAAKEAQREAREQAEIVRQNERQARKARLRAHCQGAQGIERDKCLELGWVE